jgi:spermidine synthase
MNSLGRHVIVEFFGCDPDIMNDVSYIEQSMLQAATDAHATVINSTFHHFSPFGVSGVVVIQESHLAIHTWPEYGFASVDIFTCGETVNPWVCYQILHEKFKATHGSAMEMGRGQRDLLRKVTDKFNPPDVWEDTKVEPLHVRNIWYTERDDMIAASFRHRGEMLFREQSPFQKVEVFDTYAYGKMLTLDGKVMTTERDEYVYHEMITHVPMLTHPNPRRVLVIGGGDGGAVRELVRHPELEKVVMVEIDEAVIRASKEHLPSIAAAFDHPKLELHVDDGINYVNTAPDASFDIVIIDSTDPAGPGEGLFTEEFYRNVHRILGPNGVMITQSESPRFNVPVFQEIYQCYRGIFGPANVWCYIINVPTYPSGTWSLSYSAKGSASPFALDEARAKALVAGHHLSYWNPRLHTAAFALPNYVLDLLGRPANQV